MIRNTRRLLTLFNSAKHCRTNQPLYTGQSGFCKVATGEDMDDLKKNPFFDKYSKKISKLQNESEEDFNAKLEELQKSRQKPVEKRKERVIAQQPAKPDIKSQQSAFTKTKKLQDVIKMELIEDKSASEIAEIWKEYHNKENYLSAVIQKEKYEMIEERSSRFNTFLFPLPRDQGYEFVVCQFQQNECHFTTLLNYQTYKENAPECLTLIHFPELADTKGIVLMKGEYHNDVINAIEAQCLVNQLQLYYTSDDPSKTKLMETFTHQPDAFKHNELITELQKSLVL